MADLPAYGGLDPTIANYVQSGFVPPASAGPFTPQALATSPGAMPLEAQAVDAAQAPPDYSGLPSPIAAAVQNGFAPQPAAPPVAPVTTGATVQPDGTLAMPEAPAAAPVARPDLPATVVDNSPQNIAAHEKAYAQQQAFQQSPEGLAEKSDKIKQDAITAQSAADNEATLAQQRANEATAAADAKWAERKAAQEKINAAENAENAANFAKAQQEETQRVKDAQNYKVDTNRDVGARGLIAIALSGIGNALDHNHGPNAAAEILDAQIDKRIADQRAEQGQLYKKADIAKGLTDEARQKTIYDRDQQDRDRAVILGQQADEIKSIADQTANPLMKQRAAELAASRSQAQAQIIDGIAQRRAAAAAAQRAAQQQQFENNVKQGDLGVKQYEAKTGRMNAAETVRQHDLEHDAKMAELNAKDPEKLQSMLKDTQERGIYDPNTAEPVMSDPRGQPMLDRARELDAQAAKAGSPQQALQLRTQAEQTRNQAQLLYGAKFADKESAQKGRPMISAAQTYIDDMDNLREDLKKGPGYFSREEWGKIATRYHKVAADAVQALGERVSTRSTEAVGDWIDNPDTLTGRVAPGKAIAQLDTAINDAREKFAKGMAGQGVKNLVLTRPSEVKARQDESTGAAALSTVLKGKTNAEEAEDAQPGVVSRGINAVLSPSVDPVRNAEESTPTTGAGLAPEQEQSVRKLMKGAYGANAEDNIKNLATALSSDRKSLASGVLNVLREDHVVMNAVLEYMPADKRAAVQAQLSQNMGLSLPQAGSGVPLPGAK